MVQQQKVTAQIFAAGKTVYFSVTQPSTCLFIWAGSITGQPDQ